MLNKIKVFEKELNYIKTDWIKALTKEVINNIPDYFFEIPASSTGKYHPEYSLGKGGLLRHTKAACKIANDVLSLECYEQVDEHEEYSMRDIMIAALILHDSCKSGYKTEGKYTKHEHPLLAADLVRDTLDSKLKEEKTDTQIHHQLTWYIDTICNLISCHMGQWNTSNYSKEVLPKPESTAEMLVHTFDYLASRKYITINLDDRF